MQKIGYEDIARAVCAEYGTTLDALKAQTRKRAVTLPRQVLMYLAHKHTRLSLPAIAQRLGRASVDGKRFNHTTVLHAERGITRKLAEDPELARAVARIEAALAEPRPPTYLALAA